MNDVEWKLLVASNQAEMKTDIKHIKKHMPVCEKDKIKDSIKLNRRLLFLLLTAYIMLVVTVIGGII